MHATVHALTVHSPVFASQATLAIDAHIDHRMLVLTVCASQVVTLGQYGAASGLREAGCAASGFA